MTDTKSDILQGTLDLMVLQTLDAMGPLHGYGIARRIEQISDEALQVNQGTIYLCLVRLVQKRWITAAWGTSDNNRRAKFYAISKTGRRQLASETANWARVAGTIGRLLDLEARVGPCGRDWSNGRRVCAPSLPARRSIAISTTSSSRIWRC